MTEQLPGMGRSWPGAIKPELRATLRDILDDGEWHDEDEIVRAVAPIVDDAIGLRFYQRHRPTVQIARTDAEKIIEGKREYIIAVLGKVRARLEVKRRWKRGAANMLTRSRGLDVSIFEVLADHQWHTANELLENLHVRPEVAVRKYLAYVKYQPNRPTTSNRQEQAVLGTRVYLSQIISRMRTRQGVKIERRGKRGHEISEYRLVD